MRIKDIAPLVEEISPLGLAQDWDNVGLLVGDPQAPVRTILLTIDVTSEVIAEAKALKAELIVSYHPVIWDGLKCVTAEGRSRVVYDLIRNKIGVFSIHTALDSAVGGVNDGLAEIVGIEGGEPIGDYVEDPASERYKLIVFVPVDAVEKVSDAVFVAGAGEIGDYSNCSFRTEGAGTFVPLAGASPAVGKKGKLQKVPEVKFEAVVPAERLQDAIAAMQKAHPYETPAFDVIRLHNHRGRFGLGRIGRLAVPLRVKQIVERVKKHTGAKAIGLVGDEKRLVRTAAVCAGSCGKIINSVIAAKVDLYLTGELKHHQALAAQQAGLTCICLTHSVSERFILKKLSKQLQKRTKQVTIKISKKDADPFKWKNV